MDDDILHARRQAARRCDPILDQLYSLRERQEQAVEAYQACILAGDHQGAERHEQERRRLREEEQQLTAAIAASQSERAAIATQFDPSGHAEALGMIIDRRLREVMR
jgi:hypothetical protein